MTHPRVRTAAGKKSYSFEVVNQKNLDDLRSHYSLAQTYVEGGQFRNACCALKHVLSIDPDHDGALCSLGEVYMRLGCHDKAIDCYRQGIRLNPENFQTHKRLGDACQSIGRSDIAAYAFADALKIKPDDPDIIAALAQALTRLGKKEQALICYQKAIACRPDDYTLYNQYATVLEKCNRLAEARDAIGKSFSFRPYNYGAVVNLATIEYREGDYSEAHRLLKGLNLNGKTFEAAATIKQQEGLALDKLRRYSEAFRCFEKSNHLTMQTPAYCYLRSAYEDDLRILQNAAAELVSETIMPFKKSRFDAVRNPPIFLVGFPRSGTTLMEQVLNAHPQIVTLDERSPLQHIIEVMGTDSHSFRYLANISIEEIENFRREYFDLLQKRTDACDKDVLIVDKLPLNILHLPLIYRLFPDARIIVALRHPLDCILSNFIQRFKLNKKMMNFLTLEDAARFYALTMGLYLKYRESIPLVVHEIKYERLTEDLENETKSLSAFLDIEWSSGMMAYHHTAAKRFINTPSYTEVIKPIHRKAVYRWKNYREQLSPILPIVKDYIDSFKYRV